METIYCFILNKETGEIERYDVVNVKAYTGTSRGADIVKNGHKIRYYYKENQIDNYMNGKIFTRNPDYTVARDTVMKALKEKVNQKKRELKMAQDILIATKNYYEG